MKITFIGHSCFLLETPDVRIVTDPFTEKVPCPFPSLRADVVTVSHEHHDHNAAERVGGNPAVVRGAGTHRVAGVEIIGTDSPHDDAGGAKRGMNTLFVFSLEGLELAHLGDLGTSLDSAQSVALRGVQVLFLPVGGYYTIDASRAAALVRQLPDVRVVFPMHYRTRWIADWPIDPVETFLATMDNVRRIESPSVELTQAKLPEALEVWVLEHS